MNHPINEKIVATSRELIALSERKIETLQQMIRCILIADMLGLKANEVTGRVSYRVDRNDGIFQPWRNATIHITRDGVEVLVAPLRTAALELWPEDLRASYGRHMRAEEARRVMRDA
jgi:hypothetical protein